MGTLASVTLSLLVSSLCVSITFAQTNDCSFQPISLPITNVSLPNNGAIRGAAISMGTPPQNLSFLPVMELNNTYLFRSASDCDVTQAACMTRRGGFFDQGASSTFQTEGSAAAAGAEPSEESTDGGWGKDSFALASDLTVANFPLGVSFKQAPKGDVTSQTSLGLGKSSTILSMLKDAGNIGSRTWSMWWGLDGPTSGARMDGSLVLGGYDTAKIKNVEQNHTGRLTNPDVCPQGMTVTINKLLLNFPNGSNPNLLDPNLGSSPIQACICPQCPIVMSLALDPYYNRFEAWTETNNINRSDGINYFAMMYPPNDVYQGDFTVVLDSGLSVRVPNSQLVLPDLTISGSGQVVADTKVRDVLLYSLQDVNKNDMPRLGRGFLTAAYLLVNQDEGTFTLWEANPTTERNLVAVADNSLAKACTATASAVDTATTSVVGTVSTSTNGQSQRSRTDTNSSMSSGTVGGIVAGAVVAVVAIGLLILWILRRRKHSKRPELDGQPSGPQFQDKTNTHYQTPSELSGYPPRELGDNPQSPQELWPGRQKYRHDVHEMG